METKNLQQCLSSCKYHLGYTDQNASPTKCAQVTLRAATDELQAIQSLLTVIEDFIETHDLEITIGSLIADDYIDVPKLIKDICEKVGYCKGEL